MPTPEQLLELGNIMSDFFKQMIAIDTGAIALIITIVEKVFTPERFFKHRINLLLFLISTLSFSASLLFALNALRVIPNRLTNLLQGGIENTFVDHVSYFGTIVLFLIGVGLFIFLATRSMWTTYTDNSRTKNLPS